MSQINKALFITIFIFAAIDVWTEDPIIVLNIAQTIACIKIVYENIKKELLLAKN